jgi:diguanylate cyclase (GGDEF)-like protein
LIDPESACVRQDALFKSGERDQGCGVSYRARYEVRAPGGRALSIEENGRWFAGADGAPALVHGILRVDRAANALGTGSQERATFLRQIAEEVAEASRSKRPVTILTMSITGLAELNETLGFERADVVIEEVLRRVRSVMRRRDCFAHYSGNRFALALRSCPRDFATIAAERLGPACLVHADRDPVGPVTAHIAIGAATAPDHALEAPGLLRRAEESLARAKRTPGTPYLPYDPAWARQRRATPQPTFDIVQVLNARRLTFARQPVVEAKSRALAFSEALFRIRDGDRILLARDLMPALEQTGLTPLVDVRMLELAVNSLAADRDERLAINMSPTTLESADWLTTLSSHLGANPGVASRLIVEVTETAAVRDPTATCRRLDAMKALGVSIAIDDFGAGHTSFRHLRHFPIDLIKLDGAFVQNLSRSADDRFFVRTLIDLAHHLGVATVAEWIENEETAHLLAEWGVDFLQGDHCGRPILAVDNDATAELVRLSA